MLPASQTKDQSLLSCSWGSATFQLVQSADGVSNGTGLWLGAQCLSAYLAHSGVVKPGMRAIELGSGIGLTALCLANLGCDVTATDLPWVIGKCLARNIQNNTSHLTNAGKILVRELDWTVPPEAWFWDHETIIASPTCIPPTEEQLPYSFDIIVTADTIYSRQLIAPFLRTIHALCTRSKTLSCRSPVVFICLERRDPLVIDRTLDEARTEWGFIVSRVPPRKLSKALEKSVDWDKADWEDVEIWKFTMP